MVQWIVVMKIQPSICLDDWGKPRKNPSQVGRHLDSNPGSPECESRALLRATHFVYFWRRETLPTLEVTSHIPQQCQSLPIWTTSLSTTGCYKNKYTIQFLWMACISRFSTAILSVETELALGTIRVKYPLITASCIHEPRRWHQIGGTNFDEYISLKLLKWHLENRAKVHPIFFALQNWSIPT